LEVDLMDINRFKETRTLSEQAVPELHAIRARWPQGTSADIDRLLQIIDVQGDVQTHRGLLEASIQLLRTIREGQAEHAGAIEPALVELIDAFLRLAAGGPARVPSSGERLLRN
jgi:hypothetical protein